MGIAAQAIHGVRVCVIPTPDNDHRPLALRHGPLAFVSALLIAAKVLAAAVIALTPATADLSTITSSRIVELTNAQRRQAGLNELNVSGLLTSAANLKGQDMLTYDYFAHYSPTGVTPWFWISKVGYSYQVAGENLAIDFTEAEDVVAAWMASPTHRENLLHPAYTEIGVAAVTGEFQGSTSIIVVQMFGLPSGQQVAAEVISATSSPTPLATPNPSPTPTPIPTPPPDTAPPRTPRIALVGPSEAVQQSVRLSIAGEPGSQTHVLINSQERLSVTLPASGSLEQQINLSDIPDGTVVIKAFSTDPAGNQSEVSTAVILTKDTIGPQLARQDVSFLVAPAIDQPQASLYLPSEDVQSIIIEINGEESQLPLTTWSAPIPIEHIFNVRMADAAGNITRLHDITLRPNFHTDQLEMSQAPAYLSLLTHRLTLAIFISLIGLLALAILIRIRIQRPGLIAHSLLVVCLAAALLFL